MIKNKEINLSYDYYREGENNQNEKIKMKKSK